jgi:hypothetical protein
MFRGYTTIRLNKALGDANADTTCDYSVTIFDVMGRRKDETLKLSAIERDFGKLRMNGDRFGKLVSGTFTPISEEEFERLNPTKEDI